MAKVGNKAKLLLVGPLPPPIGGVTTHFDRLAGHLRKINFDFDLIDFKTSGIFSVLKAVTGYKVVHLHTSNALFQLGIVLLCKILGIRILFTFHGNLGRFKPLKNALNNLTVFLAHMPVLLNEGSYERAKKLNKNSLLSSAFLPPVDTLSLSEKNTLNIRKLKERSKLLFCTNAFNITFDKDGGEIYGITRLIEIFRALPHLGLVFSDPSTRYLAYLVENQIEIPENVLIISELHDFVPVIQVSDGFIRATSTDGDSLSVKEALYYRVPVLASDCVSRPQGCRLYKTGDFADLKHRLVAWEADENTAFEPPETAISTLLPVYKSLTG